VRASSLPDQVYVSGRGLVLVTTTDTSEHRSTTLLPESVIVGACGGLGATTDADEVLPTVIPFDERTCREPATLTSPPTAMVASGPSVTTRLLLSFQAQLTPEEPRAARMSLARRRPQDCSSGSIRPRLVGWSNTRIISLPTVLKLHNSTEGASQKTKGVAAKRDGSLRSSTRISTLLLPCWNEQLAHALSPG